MYTMYEYEPPYIDCNVFDLCYVICIGGKLAHDHDYIHV